MTINMLLTALLLADGPLNLPPPMPPSPEMVAQRAQEDPEGYRDVLINCASYHGAVAVKKSNAGISSKGHDDMAITLLTAAGLVPPGDMDAVTSTYTDQVMAFVTELNSDASGGVEQDLVKLGQFCTSVEPYAEQQVLAALAAEEAAPDEAPAAQ